ncbi:hypothetical protein AAY473_033445 [Plecturocebus cupreus]
MPVVPATREAEAGESLEPGRCSSGHLGTITVTTVITDGGPSVPGTVLRDPEEGIASVSTGGGCEADST